MQAELGDVIAYSQGGFSLLCEPFGKDALGELGRALVDFCVDAKSPGADSEERHHVGFSTGSVTSGLWQHREVIVPPSS